MKNMTFSLIVPIKLTELKINAFKAQFSKFYPYILQLLEKDLIKRKSSVSKPKNVKKKSHHITNSASFTNCGRLLKKEKRKIGN